MGGGRSCGGLLRCAASTAVMATTGMLSRSFIHATQRVEVENLESFLRVLEARRKAGGRTRGLLTVSNHISVLDDPLVWGLLPMRYLLSPQNLRYSLGSHDICFRNPIASTFFSLGQVLPTYRLHKDPRGGLFQGAITESIRRLSSPEYAWMHIFPEGRIHQQKEYQMRYFRWGVSRLILEPIVQPMIIPMFLTGFCDVMHESRAPPRFVPRAGKSVGAHFGDVAPEERFADLRREWGRLREKYGEFGEELRGGREAVEIRIETTARVRGLVLELRRRLGFPEEDKDAGKVETYKKEGMRINSGRLADGSWEKDT